MADVDLFLNCFERNYREVLDSDLLARLQEQNRFRFAQRTLLINNVDNRDDARARAEAAQERGSITRYAFVADHIERALSVTGMGRGDLGRIAHYSDYLLVGMTLDGPDWFVQWDGDVYLRDAVDWITPSLAYMEREPAAMVANPKWTDGTVERETVREDGDFLVSQSFSDQCYLGRRSEFSRPMYHQRCLSRYRYPLSEFGFHLEARIDAWMRHHGRFRAVYRHATYVHPSEGAATGYPDRTLAERARRFEHDVIKALLYKSPPQLRPRCSRVI